MRLSVLVSQMLPPIVLVLPLFAIFLSARLLNTHRRHRDRPYGAQPAVPGLDPGRLLREEVRQLEEAARIEGATRFQAFYMIAVPVAAPGLLAAGLLAFILQLERVPVRSDPFGQGHRHPAGRPRRALETQRGVEIAPLAAATLVACLPVFVVTAAPAAIPDQGALARRAEVTGRGSKERDEDETLCC